MNLKDFSNLIEIQSIQNQIKQHLDEITSQENRIKQLTNKKNQSANELLELGSTILQKKAELQKNENALYLLESKIEKAKSNQMLVNNPQQLNAVEKELLFYKEQKEKLETEILNQMEELSSLQESQETVGGFSQGIDKSISIVSAEAMEIIKTQRDKINDYQTRIASLETDIPKEAREIFSNANKKHLYNFPITLIQNNACSKCNYPIDRNMSSLIEKGTILELCPGCERLIAPHSAQYLPS
ncbi:MAG: hypothetical protein A2381_00465 [Bdellovibrionales bacterium RIFOXYB1_FULL_37_110]|nr:MAG: hypothetical protein A2417_11520 [Bdellovibrionales bacterium RIFOXYC1_FULL_37_79]OFZ60536.1 MAG: hypothetical protein A2328_10155 [Bdellovibrionales bacterium RIFOXYB2_FULL_36_6]OFZ60867.1 MAG: hypothetical protein A2381_00465 [Bdellovibrionales bacterium RIFOXYB1_FULL_37_110]OFZ62397.1 MAG: hypothetical protein A2577_03130 [Bdellovibrionales bacterium RIFOXYD1_FULL_36_51]